MPRTQRAASGYRGAPGKGAPLPAGWTAGMQSLLDDLLHQHPGERRHPAQVLPWDVPPGKKRGFSVTLQVRL